MKKIPFKRYKTQLHNFICFCVITLIPQLLFAQAKTNAVAYYTNELSRIVYVPELPGWYTFKPAAVKDAAGFFINYKKIWGLGDDDQMRFVKVNKDESNIMHYRFQQYYKGIKIEGAEYILHEQNGFVSTANGKMVYGMNTSVNPGLSEATALQTALQLLPASAYKISNTDNTVISKNAYHPKGELCFQKSSPDILFTPSNFKLCYHFNIYFNTGDGYSIYINAQNGTLVSKLPLQSDCSSTSITTNFYGSKTIYTSYNSSTSNYTLKDDCTPTVITVNNNNNLFAYQTNPYLRSTNTSWSSGIDLQSASTSLWACRRAVDFYSSIFARNGYDNNGGDVNIYQNAKFNDSSFSNASMSFSGGNLKVGNDGTNDKNTDDWNTLDIIAHEFTHAVTGATSNLNYLGESGSLNESFSDIMGTYAEYWDGSGGFDWLIGEDRKGYLSGLSTPLRSMSNPKTYNQPDTYLGTNWYNTSGTSDFGGVHTNSGVQNYWFYLLSAGGTGTNDNSKSYKVNGVGIDVAGFIAYKTDIYYLTSSAQYADARRASTQAAVDYYGECSNVSQQVENAWNAVGVSITGALLYTDNNTATPCGNYYATGNFVYMNSNTSLNIAQSCAVTLNASASPYAYALSADNTVYLLPGFSALEGANVDVFTHSCNLTGNSLMKHNSNSTAIQSEVNAGIANSNKNGLIIYPNPASSLAHIEFTTPVNQNNIVIEIYNAEMQKIKQVQLDKLPAGEQNIPLNLSGLSSGMYYIIVYLQAKQLSAKISIIH